MLKVLSLSWLLGDISNALLGVAILSGVLASQCFISCDLGFALNDVLNEYSQDLHVTNHMPYEALSPTK